MPVTNTSVYLCFISCWQDSKWKQEEALGFPNHSFNQSLSLSLSPLHTHTYIDICKEHKCCPLWFSLKCCCHFLLGSNLLSRVLFGGLLSVLWGHALSVTYLIVPPGILIEATALRPESEYTTVWTWCFSPSGLMLLLLRMVCQSHKILSVKESTYKIQIYSKGCTYNIMRSLEIVLIYLISDNLMPELLFLDEIWPISR